MDIVSLVKCADYSALHALVPVQINVRITYALQDTPSHANIMWDLVFANLA